MLLHVSILRSSSLLLLAKVTCSNFEYVVIFISDVAAYRVFVYAFFSVQGGTYVSGSAV